MLLLLPDITDWATRVIDRLGYVGVAALVALENVVPPIPSEVVLPLAGFQANRGDFFFPLLLIAATIGSVVGAFVLYGIGAALGEARLQWLVTRYGRFVLVGNDDVDQALSWFRRYGRPAIFFGRLVPVVRSLISIPAGIHRMSLGTFALYTTLGSAVWNFALIGLGYLLGTQWDRVERYVKAFEYLVIAAAVIAVLYFLTKRFGARRALSRSVRT